MSAVFLAAIISQWGDSRIWWKRQTALMILLAFCTLGRGAEIVSGIVYGVSWVLPDGSLPMPHYEFTYDAPQSDRPVGFLLLIMSRKNKQNVPTWIPVAERSAIRLMAAHIRWRRNNGSGKFLFPARKRTRRKGQGRPVFTPNGGADTHMSTGSFRTLIRKALVECCGLSQARAKLFGTHSPRIGVTEELRRCGVPQELRQQLGGWMSRQVALSYLQLDAGAQFDILNNMAG